MKGRCWRSEREKTRVESAADFGGLAARVRGCELSQRVCSSHSFRELKLALRLRCWVAGAGCGSAAGTGGGLFVAQALVCDVGHGSRGGRATVTGCKWLSVAACFEVLGEIGEWEEKEMVGSLQADFQRLAAQVFAWKVWPGLASFSYRRELKLALRLLPQCEL